MQPTVLHAGAACSEVADGWWGSIALSLSESFQVGFMDYLCARPLERVCSWVALLSLAH